LQSEIAKTVSDKLRLKLTTTEQERVSKANTTSSEAQQLYLKGRFHWNKRTTEDFQRAREYFQQAIANDPSYALAHTGLADTLALMPYYGNFRPSEYMPLAKQSAQKALELDSNLAEAHASLGQILVNYDYDFKGAERELKTVTYK
jgi:tetratricopeptide (TPR) repeat protein